jgi:hypothetical protein
MKTQDTEGWAIPSSPRVPLPFRFGFPSPSVARPVFCRHRSQRRMRVGQKTGWATALNGATETEMQRKCQNSPLKRMGQPPRPVSLTRPPKLSEHSSDSPTHFPEEPKKIGPSGCRGWVWMILETRRNDGTTERRNDGTTERRNDRNPDCQKETQMVAETARMDADTSETQTTGSGFQLGARNSRSCSTGSSF